MKPSERINEIIDLTYGKGNSDREATASMFAAILDYLDETSSQGKECELCNESRACGIHPKPKEYICICPENAKPKEECRSIREPGHGSSIGSVHVCYPKEAKPKEEFKLGVQRNHENTGI